MDLKRIKVKICGMREPENVLQVASFSPDYMGFIFYPKSPRYVGEHFTLPDNFPVSIKKVGVFVNDNVETIIQQTSKYGIRWVQLHGNESVQQCADLKEKGYTVIKVFSVGDDFDFGSTSAYKDAADYFLFDTKGKYYGGNAKVFNWDVLTKYDQDVPFFLSGGLSTENVRDIEILKDMNLYAVDINSGVEDAPGKKNTNKVKELIGILRESIGQNN